MSGDGGPDYFGFFTHELEDLFSKEKDVVDGGIEDYFPFMSFKSDDVKKDLNATCESDGVKQLETLFSDGLGGELSDYKKEKLKGFLKQSVSALTQEVDQMVEIVLSTCELQHKLRSEFTTSGSQGLASEDNTGAYPSKKHKMSTSQENRKFCVYCNVTETSMWRRTPNGSRMCNTCGLRRRKGTLQISPEKEGWTIKGSLAEAGSKNEEVSDDLKFLLDNDREHVQQTMKKYMDEISSSLGQMEHQLEGFLNNITSKCRNMTFFERQRLFKMVKDLPPKNLDRVAEIVRHGQGLNQHELKDMLVDLEDMDNTVLWRLYHYVEAVENAQKLVA